MHDSSDEEEFDRRLAKLPRTELGLAYRFVRRFGGRCRYVRETGRWIVWDGQSWQDSQLAAEHIAQLTVLALVREAKTIPADEE